MAGGKESSSLRELGYVKIAGFLERAEAAELVTSCDYLPVETVRANEGSFVSFGRQVIPEFHPVRSLMTHRGLALVRSLFDAEFVAEQIRVWTSVYRLGEHIDRHRDRSGNVQLMVCLKNDAVQGGSTHFECLDGEERVERLRPGDAVLFRAREIFHFTDPVEGPCEEASGVRCVAVGRFYRAGA